MRAMVELIAVEYERRPTKKPGALAEWLRDFHVRLAKRLHDGQAVLDLIPE